MKYGWFSKSIVVGMAVISFANEAREQEAAVKQQLIAALDDLPISSYRHAEKRYHTLKGLADQLVIDERSLLRYRYDSQHAYYLDSIGQVEAADAIINRHANNPYASKAPRAHARFLFIQLERANNAGDKMRAEALRDRIKPLLTAWPTAMHGEIYYYLGTSYAVFGEYRPAVKYLTIAESHFKQDVNLKDDVRDTRLEAMRNMLGYVYFDLQDYPSALVIFKGLLADAIAAKKEDGFYHYNVAITHVYLGQHKKGLEHAKASARLSLEHNDEDAYAVALEMQAKAYLEMNQPARGLSLQQRAHAIFEKSNDRINLFTSHIYQADMQQRLGLIDAATANIEAAKQYESYVGANADDPLYYQMLAGYYERVGDLQNALLATQKTLALERKDFEHAREQQAARLMIEYELDSAQREAKRLTTENALKAAALEEKEAREALWQKVALCITVGVMFLIAFTYREYQSRRKFHHLAMTDPLTDVPNRRAVMAMAEQALQKQQSCLRPVTIAMIDLDHFKRVNDNYGHDVGDEVLRQFVSHCTPFLRKTDHIGRIGGEEFLLVLNDTDAAAVEQIFARLQASLKTLQVQMAGGVETLPLTVSMGAVVECNFSPSSGGSLKKQVMALLKRADDNVYAAKHNGRDRIVVA
jgi:diguanylate cyclase (GGDEF)-like protein